VGEAGNIIQRSHLDGSASRVVHSASGKTRTDHSKAGENTLSLWVESGALGGRWRMPAEACD